MKGKKNLMAKKHPEKKTMQLPDKPANCKNEQHFSENIAVENDNLVYNTDSRNTPDKT